MNKTNVLRWRWSGLGVVAATAMVVTMGAAAPAAAEGPVLGTGNPHAIADSYIVVFKASATTDGRTDPRTLTGRLAAKYDVRVEHTYEHALRGFAGTMSRTAARRLAADPAVSYVEQNGVVRALDTQPNPPSWGLDRVDQRDLPLNGSYTYSTTASNVRAYVIDTGIRTSHTTFGGRASWGTNTTGDGNNSDCNGHGTHVAGTIGGSQYGVAKAVSLVAVKVLGCSGSGSWAGVTAGVDWVTGHHTAGVPAVANMSLGGGGSNTTLENAVRNSIADGVVYAIASGNSSADACNYTPARVAEAITVNATTSNDARAWFSNWGTCTDIFAPGDAIVSAYHTSDTATASLSGTSMAAPHVAGAAALILADNPGLTPAQVAGTMFSNATLEKVTSPGTGSPNRLLLTNIAGGPPGTAALTRYWWDGVDHVSSTTHPGGGYVAEATFGKVLTSQAAGTHPLYQCQSGSDRFTSLQASCEGRTILGLIGYVYTSAPAAPSVLLYRCYVPGTWEHFDSTVWTCEGQASEGPLGYLLL